MKCCQFLLLTNTPILSEYEFRHYGAYLRASGFESGYRYTRGQDLLLGHDQADITHI
jgi:hypothetical protein